MPHCFKIMVNGKVDTYLRYEDIPEILDHVIEFDPEIPPPPHNDKDHDEIDLWKSRFKDLMERERASSSKNR